jgi:hypothetical protein
VPDLLPGRELIMRQIRIQKQSKGSKPAPDPDTRTPSGKPLPY